MQNGKGAPKVAYEEGQEGHGRLASKNPSLRARLMQLYGWLDKQPAFRPILAIVVALWVGVLVAPEFRVRAYPTDGALIGMPVTENIKAPYDLEIVDTDATDKQLAEAARGVRKVYDYDSEVVQRLQDRVVEAFVLARAQPSLTPKQDQQVRLAFEEALHTPLSDETWVWLQDNHFAAAIENAVLRLLATVQSDPLIDAKKTLEPERALGISLQRVPISDKQPPGVARAKDPGPMSVHDITSVQDVPTARREVLRLAQYLYDHGDLLPDPMSGSRALGPRVADLVGHMAAGLIEPNVTINRAATHALRLQAQERVQPVKFTIKKNEMIIRDGERLSGRHLMILRSIGDGSVSRGARSTALGGLLLFALMGSLAFGLTKLVRRDKEPLTGRDLLFLAALFTASLTLCRGWLLLGRALHDLFSGFGHTIWLFCLPVSMGALVARLVLRQELALLFAVLHSLTLALFADGDRLLGAYALCGCVAAIVAIRNISARSDLLRAGLWAALAQSICAVGMLLFEGAASPMSLGLAVPAALVGGLGASVLALSITPMLEWTFNYTTDLKLLELANLNHPALKELIVQAPGSYHHSIVVGALVEAAAESVGANSLLARVMAYYHDLGKGCNSGYFIENQRLGQNPHDKLRPSMSAMIIRRHVTDGIALAQHYGLGEQITAGIAQHHGNTLIHVFYHKACELADPGVTVNEADFRYPGQKPQTREAALVMLGDSIEAASRALADPTEARLQGLVNRIISSKFADGQLEQCDLTLRDLHTIAKSFQKVLMGIYHHRLAYPDVLQEGGKKGPRVDLDSKPPRPAQGEHQDVAGVPQDHLKRLGLS